MLKRPRFFLPALVFLILLPNAAFAELELRKIMKELGGLTEGIKTAINKGDFDAISKNATEIGDHRGPSMAEMTRILEFLKPDSQSFIDVDAAVHEAALGVADAAEGKDMNRVAEKFSALLKGCDDCHMKYRDRIVGQFYKR